MSDAGAARRVPHPEPGWGHGRGVIAMQPAAVWGAVPASLLPEVQVGPFVGRDRVMEWMTRFWRYQRDQRRHVFTNFVVDEFDGEQITAYCYLQLFGSRHSESKFETAGFVRFVLARAGDHWAIRRFAAGFDSPFWGMPVDEMSDELIELFGITVAPGQ